jgi:hypothetical protein
MTNRFATTHLYIKEFYPYLIKRVGVDFKKFLNPGFQSLFSGKIILVPAEELPQLFLGAIKRRMSVAISAMRSSGRPCCGSRRNHRGPSASDPFPRFKTVVLSRTATSAALLPFRRPPLQQNAVGLCVAPSHPAPKLVELGEAEPIAIFHNHKGGIGHIHTHFNDGGRHEYLGFPVTKEFHGGLFFLWFHFTVDKGNI